MSDKPNIYNGFYGQAHRKKQQGVALITALIITSVAVSLATLIIYRQQIQIRLSSNISTLEQNYQYAYGMEDFAGTILRRSFEDQPNFVSLNDDWYAESGLVLPITGGVMTGKLFDLQARINVNSLIRPRIEIKPPAPVGQSVPANGTVQIPEAEKEYIDIASVTKLRLTELIRIVDEQQDMGPAQNFTAILKDWIDTDQDNGNSIIPGDDRDLGNGAETSYYQSIEPAYFSANTEMISPTELRLIKNMQEKFYKRITDDIATLPTQFGTNPTVTAINVNTASENVLRSLGFTPDSITNIIEARDEEPFENIDTFKAMEVVRRDLKTETNPDALVDPLDLDVKSEYFLLEGRVEINNTRLFINSILWRNSTGAVSVIMRDFSNPQTISKAIN
ncbi:MAG: type II secretion system minor pseudopilin GspK [Cocleimonas sp.]